VATHFFMSPLGSQLLRVRRPLVVASQVLLLALAYALAFTLRHDLRLPASAAAAFWLSLPVVLAVQGAVFGYFDLYRGWWRYVGMEDLKDIVKAATVAGGALAALAVVAGTRRFPIAIVVADWLATITFVGGIRFLIRAFREGRGIRNVGGFRNVLIVGAKEIGVAICREMRANLDLKLNPVGFLDDFAAKKGFKIHGVPILGGRKDLPRILERYSIDEVIIAQPGLPGRELREFVEEIKAFDVRVKIVPRMRDLLAESVSIRHLREVDLEDLLGRESVKLDTDAIRGSIEGRTVFITGAGGSIGSELARQVAAFRPERLVLYERNENNLFYVQLELATKFPGLEVVAEIGDILDAPHLRRVLARTRPALVYHAAAYKHVPMMEINPVEAIRNNVLGTRCVVEEAIAAQVERFVLISTDKAVRPMNVMGMTKRVTELLGLGAPRSRTRFVAVRFGNVLGSNGSVIPLFRKQIEEGGPVTVTHPDATRFFMTIPEAVQLVMQAATMGQGGDVFVLEMGQQVKILDLAINLIRLSGFQPERDIEIRFTGLRRGEKLREELYTDQEDVQPTAHEKIKVLRGSSAAARADMAAAVAALEDAVRSYDPPRAIRVLWEICYDDAGDSPPAIGLDELLLEREARSDDPLGTEVSR
jgi:FlaA1/EpsC-like NDP-sugar epimerase